MSEARIRRYARPGRPQALGGLRPRRRRNAGGGGGGPSYRFDPSSDLKIAAIGDSFIQGNNGVNIAGTVIDNQADGEIAWALFLNPCAQMSIWKDMEATGPLFRGANYGIAGDSPKGMLDRCGPWIASPAQIGVYAGGTNTGSTDYTDEEEIGFMTTTWDAWLNSDPDRVLIIRTVWPRLYSSGTTPLSDSLGARMLAFNVAIRAYCAANDRAYLWDPWDDLVDPGGAKAWSPLTGMLRSDGVHPAVLGAYKSGKRLAELLATIVSPGLWFDDLPGDNLALNGDMKGTGGTPNYQVSGVVPNDWSVINAAFGSADGIVQAVCSVPDPVAGGMLIHCTSTGAGSTSTNVQGIRLQPTTTRSAASMGVATGDHLRMFTKVRISASDGALVTVTGEMQNQVSSPPVNVRGFAYPGNVTNRTLDRLPEEAIEGWIQTESLPVITGQSIPIRPLQIDIAINVNKSVDVFVEKVILKEVNNPQVDFPYVVPENTTGNYYRPVWKDDFKSLSIRTSSTGQPTPAGYTAGKGIYTPAGYWNVIGTWASELLGARADRKGHDFFLNRVSYSTLVAADPTFPPLGMLDITDEGLILKCTSDHQPVRDLLPWNIKGKGTDIVDGTPNGATGGAWYDNLDATSTTGSAVDGLPAPCVIASGGNIYGRREYYAGSGAVSGQSKRFTVKFRHGTSGKGFFFINNGSNISDITFTGTTLDATTDAGGAIEDVFFLSVGGHLEVSFTYTSNATGLLAFGLGPNSTTAGQTISWEDITILDAVRPFLSGMVSTLYSAKMKPPFMRRTLVTVPEHADHFPAVWGLGNKNRAESEFGQSFEIDDMEWFGTTLGTDTAASALHVSRSVGPNYNGWSSPPSHVTIPDGVFDRQLIVEAECTMTHVRTWVDGIPVMDVEIPEGAEPNDFMHSIINLSMGMHWMPSPDFTGTLEMTVRSIEYFGPLSNENYEFPELGPVPVVTWRSGFEDGDVSSATAGTVVADLSGATSYTALGVDLQFVVDGSTLKVKSGGVPATASIWIEGVDAAGVPGIAPKIEVAA